jgi:hypothetical protein
MPHVIWILFYFSFLISLSYLEGVVHISRNAIACIFSLVLRYFWDRSCIKYDVCSKFHMLSPIRWRFWVEYEKKSSNYIFKFYRIYEYHHKQKYKISYSWLTRTEKFILYWMTLRKCVDLPIFIRLTG